MGQAAVSESPDNFQTDLSVGEILRRTRIHYGQSLHDIERALRIRYVQLEALENGDYAKLPGKVYIIGFIRTYAEYLGLNGEKMVGLYKSQSGTKTGPAAVVSHKEMSSDVMLPQYWQVAVSVLAVLFILVAWWSMRGEDDASVNDVPPVREVVETVDQTPPPQEALQENLPETKPEPVAQEDVQPVPDETSLEIGAAVADLNQPSGEKTLSQALKAPPKEDIPLSTPPETPAIAEKVVAETPPPIEETGKGIILTIKKNSWVEIRGKDGRTIVSRVLKAGDRYFVPDRPDLTISLGNAGGVDLEVDGQKLRPLGHESQVRRNIPLDAKSLKKNYGRKE